MVQPSISHWRRRRPEIKTTVKEITLPSAGERRLAQNEEWCEIVLNGKRQRIRFHDYHEIYRIPGLYEQLFYDRLECCSPWRVVDMLAEVLPDFDEDPRQLRVLDVGAGNGMVGDELKALGIETIVGLDIIREAKTAAFRDRPDVYDGYHIADLTNLSDPIERDLRKQKLNCLATVAALGFEDIPPLAFIRALDLIETPGWMAFNIKEEFLDESDPTGFCRLVRLLGRERIVQPQAYRRYRHRLGIDGKGLHYVAMVARKLKPIPEALLVEKTLHAAIDQGRLQLG